MIVCGRGVALTLWFYWSFWRGGVGLEKGRCAKDSWQYGVALGPKIIRSILQVGKIG
jgi:hypothetical protein